MNDSHEDRCVGCLLGVACGDILGAAVEGWPAAAIRQQFGALCDFQDSARGFGRYTDDTQMTVALTASLTERGRVDPGHVSATYAELYQRWRGYGGGAHRVIRALRRGADYRGTGRLQFPDGSFGNGGAMRIAPVGLAYRHAGGELLHQAVEAALLCTHVHPEAVDGALVQAKAVGEAAKTADPSGLDVEALPGTLRQLSHTAVMREKLDLLAEGLRRGAADDELIGTVGNGVRASEAVAAALWAFVRYHQTPEECIVRAVGFGGDTDTIGAMAGALVGALHGTSWIPPRWYESIENGSHGRDEIVELAQKLAGLNIVEEHP